MRTQTAISRAVYRQLDGTPSRTLADRIGVDPAVVLAWLSGQQAMTTEDIDALAAGLEMSPFDLVDAAVREAAAIA